MQSLWNAASKRSASRHAALTARIDGEVLEGLHRTYQTGFALDDEVLRSHCGCMNNKNNTHPLPWALVLAWGGTALSLTLILYIVLMGGLDLG